MAQGWVTVMDYKTSEEIAWSRTPIKYYVDGGIVRVTSKAITDIVWRTCLAEVAIFDSPYHGSLIATLGITPISRDVSQVDIFPWDCGLSNV